LQNDEVQAVLRDVYGQWGYVGAGCKFVVFLTDNGILFAVTSGTWRTGIVEGVRGGLTAGAGAAGAAASGGIEPIEHDYQLSKAGEFEGESLDQIMQSHKNNVYLTYAEIKSAKYKKHFGCIDVNYVTDKGKFYTRFQMDPQDIVNSILTAKLGSRLA